MKLYFKASLLTLLSTLLMVSQLALAALVEIPALKAHVTDLTNTLTPQEVAQLEQKLVSFEAAKGSQVAILIVPTTAPEEIDQYSMRVVETWKLGRKDAQDGLLILLDVGRKKSRIEVDNGLQGAIPDLTAHRIRTDIMRPYLRGGDVYGGLNAGVDAVLRLIGGEALPEPKQASLTSINVIEEFLPLLLFGGMVSGMFLRGIFGTFFGSVANGGLIGSILFFVGLSLLGAGVLGVVAFVFTVMMGSRGMNGHVGGFPTRTGGYSGGFGGLGGGDIFSGGGSTGWSGGGASGDW